MKTHWISLWLFMLYLVVSYASCEVADKVVYQLSEINQSIQDLTRATKACRGGGK